MIDSDDIKNAQERKKLLTETSTNILTPNLGKGFHFLSAYHRIQFIAKVIEYLVSKYPIENIAGNIILEAVCKTSWYLGLFPSEEQLKILLIEMATKLDLLEIEELGSIKISNPMYFFDKSQPKEINKFLGYSYKLSLKGWESYQKQEYQILAAKLKEARISRYVSYTAVVIALGTFLLRLFLK